jgi:hypothetical protein
MSQALAPRLPTYRTAAAVLEGHTGSGLRLLGWTIARTALIAPPMMLVGVSAKQAIYGAVIASALISSLTLLRIGHTGPMGVDGYGLYGARPRSYYRRYVAASKRPKRG